MTMASVEGIIDAIDAYLQFVLSPDRLNEDSGERLAGLVERLDWLAVSVTRPIAYKFDEEDYGEPPDVSHNEINGQIAANFPELKHYYVIPTESASDTLVSDPWNDIADIYADLHNVRWRMTHTSKEDALFELYTSYGIHWGLHLRQLQLYLHELLHGL